MAQQQFDLQSPSGRCAVTGRELREGEEFYSVLFEDGESFRRVDYSLEGWTGPPEGAFCHFKSRVPFKEKKKQLLVNNEVLVHFFRRLAEETEPVRIQFRFVLALILMRKRLLRYEGAVRRDDREVWRMTLLADRSTHEVINPDLSEEQIEGVSRQLSAILHSDMGDWAALDEEEVPPSSPADEAPAPSESDPPPNPPAADREPAG